MKHCLLFCLCLFSLGGLWAQGPVTLNGRSFQPCDSIQFEWDGQSIGKPYRLASLHVWIDDLDGKSRWKFRYPIVNGKAEGALEIPAFLPPGNYAFNFMGAEEYLQIRGTVKKMKVKTARNHETGQMDTILVEQAPGWVGQDIKYNLTSREGVLFDSTLNVATDGQFKLPPIIFGDTANLHFKPEKTNNAYYIFLETPLDSAFTPFHTQTVFVRIAAREATGDLILKDSSTYAFTLQDPYRDAITLEEVLITGRSKAEKFERDYVSQPFRNPLDGKTFSGLDPDSDLARSNNLFTFLQANIPGMQIRNDMITTTVTWRGDPVSFFLDEVRIDVSALRLMPPSDIALIKTYPAPATMTSFVFGGAVALYSKKGEYNPNKGPRYSFIVNGYTQGEGSWK